MKRSIFLILLLAATSIYCQSLDNDHGLVSLGAFFSPNYSYRHLEYDDNMANTIEAIEEGEHPAFGFNAGLQVFFNINNWFEIETGAHFYRQARRFLNVPVGADYVEGYADVNYLYNYITLPVKLNFEIFRKNKLYFGTSLCFSTSFLIYIRSINKITYNGGVSFTKRENISIDGVNKIALGISGSIFADYNFNDRWSMRLEPIFRYSLTPLADAPIKQYNYSIGGQLGIIYNFKKTEK